MFMQVNFVLLKNDIKDFYPCRYHSESGWQTLVEIILEHYGIAADESAIITFVCVVPVFMDACVKLWVCSVQFSCTRLIVLISYSLLCNKINLLGNFEVASSRCTLYIVHLPWCGQLDQNNSSGIHKLSYSNQEIYQNLNLDTNET